MAKLTLQSTIKLKSGYELPLLGFGVSLPLQFHCLANRIGLQNVRVGQSEIVGDRANKPDHMMKPQTHAKRR